MSTEETFALLGADGSRHLRRPPTTTDAVAAVEARLGHALPKSYVQFLTEFSNGAFLYRTQFVCGIGAPFGSVPALEDLAARHVPSRRLLSPEEAEGDVSFREGGRIPRKYLLPFSPDRHGNAWCFLTQHRSIGGEYPVAYFSSRGPTLYRKLDDFSFWLQLLARRKEELILTLYGPDALRRDLQLTAVGS